MGIRDYRKADLPKLREIHDATGLGYEFPDYEGKAFEKIWIETDETGEVVGSISIRKTAELVGSMAPHGSPARKLARWKAITPIVSDWLARNGYRDVNAFVPTELANGRFGRRMEEDLKWTRERFVPFCKMTQRKKRWYEFWVR